MSVSKRTSSKLGAFTFPETIALVGVMALMAGLATQLLLQAQAFSSRVEAEQSRLQTVLRVRAELGAWVETVRPAWWADASRVFSIDGDSLVVQENPGGEGRVWRVTPTATTLTASQDGGPALSWGPLEGVTVVWWTKDTRVIGLVVEWTAPGNHRLELPWGARPL